MSLQEIQQFQEKHEVARADDIVGTDQPDIYSISCNASRLMLEIFQMIHRGGYQIFQVGYINKNWTCWDKRVKFKKAKLVLTEDKEWRNHHQKEGNTNCLRSRIRGRDCILDFWGKVVPLKTCFIQAKIKFLLKKNWHNLMTSWS